MEDVQYHLNGLFRLIKANLKSMPPEQQKLIESAANATQKALSEAKQQRRNYAVLVRDTRAAQRAFFKASKENNFTLKTNWLTKSRNFESQLDKLTNEVIVGVKQPDLFQ